MKSDKIYLNEDNEILKETDYYIIMRPGYPGHPNKTLIYKKNSIFYLSKLPRLSWNESVHTGCCISIWPSSSNNIESGERWDLTLATSHNGLKTIKVVSPADLNDLPIKIRNEIIKDKI